MEQNNINNLKTILSTEGNFRPSDEIIDELFSKCELITFKPKKMIVKSGELNDNFYIIVDGLARIVYINDNGDEITYGFGTAGAFFVSPYSYYGAKPAFLSVHACNLCSVLKISKTHWTELCNTSHEFALWMIDTLMHQFYDCEIKTEMMSANTDVSYKRILQGDMLKKNLEFSTERADVGKIVSSKVLASYLGVNPTYLSKIKRRMINEARTRDSERNNDVK